jgi:hypothetical protein
VFLLQFSGEPFPDVPHHRSNTETIATMILASLVGVGCILSSFVDTERYASFGTQRLQCCRVQLGKLNGNGQQLNVGGTSLLGRWNMGKLELGQETFDDGTIYLGEFANGVPHGFGKIQFLNGSSYTTMWAHGIKRGGGVYRDVNLVGLRRRVFEDYQFAGGIWVRVPQQ